jgi:hypothetical protein
MLVQRSNKIDATLILQIQMEILSFLVLPVGTF